MQHRGRHRKPEGSQGRWEAVLQANSLLYTEAEQPIHSGLPQQTAQSQNQGKPPRAHAVNCLSICPDAGLRPENKITTDSEARELVHQRVCSQQHCIAAKPCLASTAGVHTCSDYSAATLESPAGDTGIPSQTQQMSNSYEEMETQGRRKLDQHIT